MGLNQRSELERHIIMRGRRAGKSHLADNMATLEDMILQEQAKQMEEAINFDVLSEMLCNGLGWTRVEQHCIDYTEVDAWLKDNCKGSTKRNGHRFIFEESKDATWFAMRWS